MKIETVRILNAKGTSLIANEGLSSEFTAPIDYIAEFDMMNKENKLYTQYEKLVKWAMAGGKAERYTKSREELVKEKIDAIGMYIYSIYPEKKQNEDKSYVLVNKDIVVALTDTTSDELSTELVLEGMHYLENGERLEEYLSDKPSKLKDRYAKLYKTSTSLAWCDYCVNEGVLALSEGREPKYPPYPTFGGVPMR